VVKDDDLLAMDTERKPRMDDKTFDSLLKLTATRSGRRRLLQATATAGIGGLLSRDGAAAQVVAEACQKRQSRCDRNRECECKNGRDFENVTCDRLPGKCDRTGDRCCGEAKATCDNDCDCCKGFKCNKDKKKCVKK